MNRPLVTLLLLLGTLSELATFEGVAATTTAKEPPEAASSPRLQGNGGPVSGGTMVHVTDHAPRDRQSGNPTHHQEQPATSPPSLQKHSHTNHNSGGETGWDDSGVDTVLAALVDYSKDPKLWRFVHSVVDELDYSLRANHPQASASARHPRPALHITHPNTHWGRTSAGGKHDTGQSASHTDSWNKDSHSYLSRNGPDQAPTTTTTTTTATPLLPWLQQPPEEPFIGSHTAHNYKVSSDPPSQSSSNRVNFVKSQPSPSTHFFFHKVFLDKTFDNRTRQPYRRPVLALTARDISAAKSPVDEKGSLPDAANHTARQSDHTSAVEELNDKFDSLPEAPKHPDDTSEGQELSQDGDEKHDSDGDSQNVLTNTHHHHHHRHRLHTFKSQLQYLQRWEERLWRRAHLQPRHHTAGGL